MMNLFRSLCLALAGMPALLLPGNAGAAAKGDTTTVYVNGTLVDAPECTVNGNNIVDVDFGSDIITRQVDGTRFKTAINWPLVCNSPVQPGLTVSIKGDPAPFGSGLIKTNHDGLGIRLWNGESVLMPGTVVNFTYGGALPALYATPVAQDNTTLAAGTFLGTATLVIGYQ